MDVVTRFLAGMQAQGLWQGLPTIYRPLIVAALRRDPAAAAMRIEQLAELWRRVKEDTGARRPDDPS